MSQLMSEQETLAEAVARRVRGVMGEARISGTTLARDLGMTQQALSRRTTGSTPFRLDELTQIADALGVSEAYLCGFTNERTPARESRTGGLYGIRDSNPEPADSEHEPDLSAVVTLLSTAPSFRLPGDPRPVEQRPTQTPGAAVATVSRLSPRRVPAAPTGLGFAAPGLLATVIPFTRTERSA